MNSNDSDIYLLKNAPNELIVKYQSLISSVVYNISKSGLVNYNDVGDYIQYINNELLHKIEYIKKKYNGSSPLKIYFLVIIRNMCYEKLRKERKYDNEISSEFIERIEPENIVSNLIIEQELDYLDKILKTFHSKKDKLILCLKLLFRIRVSADDFNIYGYNFTLSEIQNIIKRTDYSKPLSDKEIFEHVTPLFNKYERKNNNSDTTRKWVGNKLNDIIDLMNGDPPKAYYSRETIQILIEKYLKKMELFVRNTEE